MQTDILPYLMLYETKHRLTPAPIRSFVIPVPVAWSLSSLHVQGPINHLG